MVQFHRQQKQYYITVSLTFPKSYNQKNKKRLFHLLKLRSLSVDSYSFTLLFISYNQKNLKEYLKNLKI